MQFHPSNISVWKPSMYHAVAACTHTSNVHNRLTVPQSIWSLFKFLQKQGGAVYTRHSAQILTKTSVSEISFLNTSEMIYAALCIHSSYHLKISGLSFPDRLI